MLLNHLEVVGREFDFDVGYSIPEFNMLPVAVEADPFNVGAGSAHTTKIPERLDRTRRALYFRH